MFGQDDAQQPGTAQPVDSSVLGSVTPDPVATPDPLATPAPAMSAPTGFSIPAPSLDPTAAPSSPLGDNSAPELPSPSLVTPPSDPLAGITMPDVSSPVVATVSTVSSDDLTAIKQQALDHLSPLVSHLDQTPEEKFRTTMMMIQASDNKDLIKDAFAAAQSITDDKTRAQALLDVINEINYFTQHDGGDQPKLSVS